MFIFMPFTKCLLLNHLQHRKFVRNKKSQSRFKTFPIIKSTLKLCQIIKILPKCCQIWSRWSFYFNYKSDIRILRSMTTTKQTCFIFSDSVTTANGTEPRFYRSANRWLTLRSDTSTTETRSTCPRPSCDASDARSWRCRRWRWASKSVT